MHCPKCYGSFDKKTQRCKSCGFSMSEFNGATHKNVKQAKKDGFGADVMMTDKLPEDVSKKKLLLLSIFLGLVGGHAFYVGKIFRALYSVISFLLVSAMSIIQQIYNLPLIFFSDVFNWIFSISLLLMGLNIVFWLIDIQAIIRNKYKVSVYKDEFSL